MWCIWVFEEFWVTQNLGQSILVTTPYCQWLLPLTNYGDQFQQWTLFILKQYCLEGILAKESSPRTKDFLLWRDLQFLISRNACNLPWRLQTLAASPNGWVRALTLALVPNEPPGGICTTWGPEASIWELHVCRVLALTKMDF